MDSLVRRRLGRTNVEVTQLGLGGAGLGDLFDVVEDADASATLQAAWDAGIRYYDTSPWYGRGQSEHRLGRALYRRPRADYVLSTKVGRLFRAFHDAENFEHGFWRGGLKFQHRFDYSYDGVMRSFEDSLQRLGLPRIDLLLIHDLDISHHATDARVTAYLTELHNGGFRALTELRQAGLISGIGAGVNEVGMMPRFLDLMDIDFFLVALPYTLLDTDVLDREFPRCVAHDVGFVIGAPFASGILATGAVPGARYRYADATPESTGEGAADRGCLLSPRSAAALCRIAVSARSLVGGVGDSGRAAGGARRPQRRGIPSRDSGGLLGRVEARGPAAARRSGAVTVPSVIASEAKQPPNALAQNPPADCFASLAMTALAAVRVTTLSPGYLILERRTARDAVVNDQHAVAFAVFSEHEKPLGFYAFPARTQIAKHPRSGIFLPVEDGCAAGRVVSLRQRRARQDKETVGDRGEIADAEVAAVRILPQM